MQAVKTDGTMWGWGHNDAAQIGDGTDKDKSSPTQVPGTTWTKQMYTSTHTAAIKTDGTLWCMGNNAAGELGQNNKTQYNSPRQVGSETDWKEVGIADRNTWATREA